MNKIAALSKARWWKLTYPFWVDQELAIYRDNLTSFLGDPIDPLRGGTEEGTKLHLLINGRALPAARRLERAESLVISGGLGSGKTTLLRHAALERSRNAEAPLPLLVNLCGWRGEAPLDYLAAALAAVAGTRLAGVLPSLLAEGRLSLLLDDFHVAIAPGESSETTPSSAWGSSLSQWPRVTVIIACLPSAAHAAKGLLSGARNAHILPVSGAEDGSPDSAGAALPSTAFLATARAGAKRPSTGLADLMGLSVERLNLPTEELERISQLALGTLRPSCFEPSDLDEQGQRAAQAALDRGLAATIHPGASAALLGSWWQAYLAARAMARPGRSPADDAFDANVNECRTWPALVLWSEMIEDARRETWVRRLVEPGDESRLLLALACVTTLAPEASERQAVIAALLGQMESKRIGAHWADAGCLGDMATGWLIPLLVSLLGDASPLHQAQILSLLGDMGGLDAARALVDQGLDLEHDLAVISADRALQRLEDLAANVLVSRLGDPSKALRERISSLLARIGTAAIGPLITHLRSGSEVARGAAAAALGEIGALAVPSMLAALRDEEDATRAAARSALQAVLDPSAVPYLLEGIRDTSTLVRKESLLALIRVARRGAAGHVAQALHDPEEEIRVALLEALDPELSLLLVADLVGVLRDPEQRVRVLAVEMLAALASHAVLPLVTAFRDHNWDAPGIATGVIERIGVDAIPPLRRALADSRWRTRLVAARALQWVRHVDVVPALGEGLRDRSARVREASAISLGRVRFRDGVPDLMTSLSDRSRAVRQAAARALGEIAAPQATRALIDALSDQDIGVRDQAILSLSLIGRPAVIELVKALDEGDWRHKKAVVDALKLIGDARAAPALRDILAEGDWRVKEAAAEALGELGDESAVQALLALLAEKRDSVRWKAVDALVNIGAPAVPGLLSTLQSRSWAPRWAAAAALGRIGEPALPALMAALTSREEEVRWAAESALGQIGDAAIPLLSSALYDREALTRQAAIEALSQIGTPRAKATLDEYWTASWTRR